MTYFSLHFLFSSLIPPLFNVFLKDSKSAARIWRPVLTRCGYTLKKDGARLCKNSFLLLPKHDGMSGAIPSPDWAERYGAQNRDARPAGALVYGNGIWDDYSPTRRLPSLEGLGGLFVIVFV